MRRPVLAVFAALALAGCGGSTKTVTQTVASAPGSTAGTTTRDVGGQTCVYAPDGAIQSCAPNTTTTATTSPAGPPTCKNAAATTDIKPITCTVNGGYLRFATDNYPLHIAGMTARFVSIRTETSLSDSSGVASARATGTFVIVTLNITNTTNGPQTVETPGASQFQLSPIGSNKNFTESFDAENGADQQSFISRNNPLQPDESQTGDVIFDVPSQDLAQMRRSGAALTFGGFGQDLTGGIPADPRNALGVLIIYHRQIP